jgi:double-strand break repair protein MRE11
MPEEGVLASLMSIDNIKVEKLVREFLVAQSLKILPRTHFGDAVTQYVDKDDKHAMETFVEESLTLQVQELLTIGQGEDNDEKDLEPIMDRIRLEQEERFKAGLIKRTNKSGKYAPRPENWDSDALGEWEDNPAALMQSGDEDDTSAPASRRGRGVAALFSDDDDASMISQPPTKKAPAKRAPAKKAPAKPRVTAKAKTPAKAAAKAPARGRKKIVEISDDEEEDVIMQDDSPNRAQKSQPKRAAAAKGRQTTLNFSQSQAKTQAARELSDDEISEDDAFEPMTKKR